MRKIIRGILGLFRPPFTRKKVVKLFILSLVAIMIFNVATKEKSEPQSSETKTAIVFVGTVDDLSETDGATFVGTVRAVNEAQILSETSGRVTSVLAQAGDTVAAGTILASIENASEQAALLQAQGSYEAALAGAAQSEISVESAESSLVSAQNGAVTTYRNAYTTTKSLLVDDIDTFFVEPEWRIPGVRINITDGADFINRTRSEFQTAFNVWAQENAVISTNSDLKKLIETAEADTQTLLTIVDILIDETDNASETALLDGELVTSYTSGLITVRSSLNQTLSSLANAKTSLSSAEENLRRAQIGATQNTEASLANAQVKQALGALRNAQAMYEKTIFRSPISGTVNSLSINVGDFVSAFTQVAEVANNDALQISIYVGEIDLPHFVVGNEVYINENTKGTITSVAPAIDPATQKTEVKIAAESTELINGSTVSVTVDRVQIADEDITLFLPITAIKFEAQDGFIFTVEDGVLSSHPVTLGRIQGSSVEILEGATRDTVFVIDARGLTAGQKVEAARNQ